jgi:DNA-binding transcriptional LysR family regulator
MDSISDLYAFCEIVALGSFVRAARSLNMTPSGVSKKLSRFEERLNVRLLNRTTRTLALTEAGRDLYAQGKSILASIDEAEARAKHVSLTPRGRLRIACSDAFAVQVLAPMLSVFQERYPEVSITLIQGDGPIDIIEEEVDVAIRFERPTNAAFVAKRLIQDPWVVCASPSYFQIFPEMILDDDDRAIYAVYPHREYLPVKVRVFVDELESTISMRR